MKRILSRILLALVAIVVPGMLIPQNLKMPVVGADGNSYNHETFWYEGWGTSIVHKGIDVFARRGTRVNSATIGIVLLTTEYGKGGKFVLVLGPKWRLHYYAHLDEECLSLETCSPLSSLYNILPTSKQGREFYFVFY